MDDHNLARLLREIEEERQLKKRRKEHTYVEDLMRLLLSYKDGLRRSIVLDRLEKQRKKDGFPFQRTSSSPFRAPTTRTA